MMSKEYWITNSRFKLIFIALMLMWGGIMFLLYLKADEVTKNPCQICAEKLGNNVQCLIGDLSNAIQFYPNGSLNTDPFGIKDDSVQLFLQSDS